MELKGRAASAGKITGRARVLFDPVEADKVLEDGDILVTKMTGPDWTSLFSRLGGVVTEVGGILSHPAIIAREAGIPAIVSCKDVTSYIADGAIVTIDGSTGTIIT